MFKNNDRKIKKDFMIIKTDRRYYLSVRGIDRIVRISYLTVKSLEMLGVQTVKCVLPSEYYLG